VSWRKRKEKKSESEAAWREARVVVGAMRGLQAVEYMYKQEPAPLAGVQ
jgi:hypothetical protein